MVSSTKSLFKSCKSFLADTIGNQGRATPELIARLGEMLDWPYWEVCVKAVQALGKLQCNIPNATLRRLLELRSDPSFASGA